MSTHKQQLRALGQKIRACIGWGAQNLIALQDSWNPYKCVRGMYVHTFHTTQDIDGFDGNLWAFAHTPPGVTKALASVGAYRAQLAAAHGRRNPDLKATYDSKIASMTAASEAAKDPQKVRA